MELMQLQMFVAMVEEKSVQKAAERVFRTQSAVSIAVRKLEEELSLPVFDRSKRYDYRLTEVGETLYSYATRLLCLRNEAAAAVAELSSLRSGRIRVGADESVAKHLLPQLTQTFLNRHSGIRVELHCGNSTQLLAKLEDRQMDVALLSFQPDNKDLESRFFLQDELILITSPKHRFARNDKIHIRDLSGQPLIITDGSSSWQKEIVEGFSKLAKALNLAVENAPLETLKRMVALGLGVGFVPLMCVQEERARGELAILSIEGFPHEFSLWAVRRRSFQSPATKAFFDVVSSVGESLTHVTRSLRSKPRIYCSGVR